MLDKSIFDNILSSNERKTLKYVGIHKMLRPSSHFTGLERKYYSMLKDLNIFFIPQYRLNGRIFDAYLPDQNIIFEFDGDFWHKSSLEECSYDFQKKSVEVDKIKNEIAKKNGIKLIRIKESSPVTKNQLKELIWD